MSADDYYDNDDESDSHFYSGYVQRMGTGET